MGVTGAHFVTVSAGKRVGIDTASESMVGDTSSFGELVARFREEGAPLLVARTGVVVGIGVVGSRTRAASSSTAIGAPLLVARTGVVGIGVVGNRTRTASSSAVIVAALWVATSSEHSGGTLDDIRSASLRSRYAHGRTCR